MAAVNTARYVKYVNSHRLVHSPRVPFNRVKKETQGEGDKEVIITLQRVFRFYRHTDSEERSRLAAFYEETKDIPFLEHAASVTHKCDVLHLGLQPVGLLRWPENPSEAKVTDI